MFPCFMFGFILANTNEWRKKRIYLLIVSMIIYTFSYILYINHGINTKIIMGITSSFILFIVFIGFCNVNHLNNSFLSIVCKMGKNTLGIYLLQVIVLEVLLRRIIHFHMDDILVYVVILPILSALILCVCHWLALLICRNRPMSKLLLGSRW